VSPPLQAGAAAAGALAACVEALKWHGAASPQCAEAACAAIRNAAGAGGLLLAALRCNGDAPDARDEALAALRDLLRPPAGEAASEAGDAASEREALRTALLEGGAIEAALDCLEQHPGHAGVQASGLGALAALAAAPDAEAAAADDGGLELAVTALLNHRTAADVAAAAAGAIVNMCVAAEHAPQLAAAGGLDALVGAMRAHPESEPVQTACCAALRNATVSPPLQAGAAAAGALGACVEALKRHGTASPQCAEAACAAIRNAAGLRDNEAIAAQAGAIEAVLAAVRVHGNYAAVQEAGLGALASIAWSGGPIAKRARDAGAPLVARAAMDTRWRGHSGVTAAARLLIQKVGDAPNWDAPLAMAHAAAAAVEAASAPAELEGPPAAAGLAGAAPPAKLGWRAGEEDPTDSEDEETDSDEEYDEYEEEEPEAED
jgi:hypothetical protein